MLTVKTFIDRSSVNGIGVFAAENIPAGTLVWEYVSDFDIILSPEQLPALARDFILRYGYLVDGVYIVCGDHARFMNHSNTPNVFEREGKDFAIRDIQAGEEITCDYAEFIPDFKGF